MSKPYIYKTDPMPHQAHEFEVSSDLKFWALFWEMGLGKSKQTLDTIAHLYRTKKIKAAMIVAPKGVYRNWEDEEIPKHMPEDIPVFIARWSSYQHARDKERLEKLWLVKDHLKILIINVEAFSHTKGGHYAETFMKYERPNIMVVDESTTIKSTKAKRSKTAVLIAKHADYRRILTGMPVTQSPMDLYNQLRFLDPYALGYSSFFAFRNRFAVMKMVKYGYRNFNQIVGYKNLDELNAIVRKMGSRLKKEDCLDLPEKIYLTRKIELTVDQYKAYNSISQDAILMLQNAKSQGILTTPLAITALMKLHQVVCGHITDDDGNIYPLANKRIEALLETIDEMEGQVVIWANYRYDVEAIVDALGKEYGADQVVSYYGGTSDDDRALARQKFRDRQVRFFVGNPSVGGYGLTLVTASNVIYYSNSYSLADRIQSEDRLHRIGQTKPVTYVDFVVPNTVDEKILKALRAKENIAKQVVDNPDKVLGGDAAQLSIERAYL